MLGSSVRLRSWFLFFPPSNVSLCHSFLLYEGSRPVIVRSGGLSGSIVAAVAVYFVRVLHSTMAFRRLGYGAAIVGLGLLAGKTNVVVQGLREHDSSSPLVAEQNQLETPTSFADRNLFSSSEAPPVSSHVLTERAQVPRGSWLCRTSEVNKGCGKRGYFDGEQVWANAMCPAGACCSKTACTLSMGCGNLCTDALLACSSTLVYRSEFSYGACSCSAMGSACDKNARCLDLSGAGGGSYCVCKEGFTGDGKTCTSSSGASSPSTAADTPFARDGKEDVGSPCLGRPCGQGKCVETGERTKLYECVCPSRDVRVSGKTWETCVNLPPGRKVTLSQPSRTSSLS